MEEGEPQSPGAHHAYTATGEGKVLFLHLPSLTLDCVLLFLFASATLGP